MYVCMSFPDDEPDQLGNQIYQSLSGAALDLFGPPSTQNGLLKLSLSRPCSLPISISISIDNDDPLLPLRQIVRRPPHSRPSLTSPSPSDPAMCGIFGYCNYLKEKVSPPSRAAFLIDVSICAYMRVAASVPRLPSCHI